METMDEGFYKISTAVNLGDYKKSISEKCELCKYQEGCLKGDL